MSGPVVARETSGVRVSGRPGARGMRGCGVRKPGVTTPNGGRVAIRITAGRVVCAPPPSHRAPMKRGLNCLDIQSYIDIQVISILDTILTDLVCSVYLLIKSKDMECDTLMPAASPRP